MIKVALERTNEISLEDREPIVKLCSQSVYKSLHHENYKPPKPYLIDRIHREAEKLLKGDIAEIIKNQVEVNLPLPKFKKPVCDWVLDVPSNAEYLGMAEGFLDIQHDINLNIPSSPFLGWSRIPTGYSDVEDWEPIEYPDEDFMVFDMEAFKGGNRHYRPFMVCAVSENYVYSWLENREEFLPEVIEFGEKFKLLLGHNSVMYDRRYIKEFYQFAHKKRMLDTFSFYTVAMGLPSDKYNLLDYFKAKPVNERPRYIEKTCRGRLDKLSEFLCGIQIDKEIKDLWVTKEGKPPLPFSNVTNNWDEIWHYCYKDVISCLEVYKKLYPKFRKNKIFLNGQIERSSLLIEISEGTDLEEFRNKVTLHNSKELTKFASECMELFKKHSNDPYIFKYLVGKSIKDYYDRVYKSKGFQNWLKDNKEVDFQSIELPESLKFIGWEDCATNNAIKSNTLRKLKEVHGAFNLGFKTKINPPTLDKIIGSLIKEADSNKTTIPHLSLKGNIAPLVLGICWNGYRLRPYRNTWAIETENGEIIRLPHPKGNQNVGTPLSKDYADTKVKSKEFTSCFGVDLAKVFALLETTGLWEKFDKRFRDAYVYKDDSNDSIPKWLPNMAPSGTITERPISPLAVVMSKPKETKAGSEMKACFGVRNPNRQLYLADYAGQESEIFCAYIASETGYPGFTSYELLVNLSDIHQYVADTISQTSPVKIERFLAKNCNFANQFFVGESKLSLMIYVGLKGAITLQECTQIAQDFQKLTRGVQNYGVYENGIASTGFNIIKRLAKEDGQKNILTGQEISEPLLERNIGKECLTTRINFNIQALGQTLINIWLMTFRKLAEIFNIQYQFAFFIHDQVVIDAYKEDEKDICYMFQIAHLVSKAFLYKKLGVEAIPVNKMYFSAVDIERRLKDPFATCKTPTCEGLPLGRQVKAIDCLPSERVMQILDTKKI